MEYNVTNKAEFYEKLPLHQKWLNREDGGERLIVKAETDLSNVDMRDANISYAIMNGADMRGAIMSGTDIRRADMRCADISNANMHGAIMSYVDMRDAIMRGADMSSTDIRRADMRGTNMRNAIIPFSSAGDDRGWMMHYQPTENGLRFYCGCHHDWAYEQCANHWLSDDYPDPVRGRAKMMVIDLIVAMYEAGMLPVKPEEI